MFRDRREDFWIVPRWLLKCEPLHTVSETDHTDLKWKRISKTTHKWPQHWRHKEPENTMNNFKVLVTREGLSVLSCVWLFAAPWTVPARLLCPWDSPGKNTGVGRHSLLQGLKPCLLLGRRILYLAALDLSSKSTLFSHQLHVLEQFMPSIWTQLSSTVKWGW